MSFHLSLKSPLKFLNFSVMNMHNLRHNLKIAIKIITGGEGGRRRGSKSDHVSHSKSRIANNGNSSCTSSDSR